MQLFLTITGMVLAGYIIFNLAQRSRLKKQFSIENEFKEIVLENTHKTNSKIASSSFSEDDPLFDGYDEIFEKPEALENPSFETSINKSEADSLEKAEAKIQSQTSQQEPVKSKPRKQDFIAITILPKHQSGYFSGHLLQAVLKKNHFYYGKHKIFHRHQNESVTEPALYSVASIMEPGNFDQEEMLNSVFPGLVIFMITPTEGDPIAIFEKMLTSARQLAAALNGELCDNSRCQLDSQSIYHYRERIQQNSAQ